MTTQLTDDDHAVSDGDEWLLAQASPPAREFHFLRAFAWAVPLVLIAGCVAYVFTELQPPTYETSSRVVLAAAPSERAEQYVVVDSVSALANRQFLGTYVDIVDSAAVKAEAVSAARVQPRDAGAYHVDHAVSPESSSVDVRVVGPDAERTAAVARNIVEEAGERFEEYYPIFTVKVLDPPVAPQAPTGPRPLRTALIVAVLTVGAWLLVLVAYGTHERA